MTVIAIGLDLVSVGRIAAMIDDHGQQFLERVFTEAERAYAGDRRRRDEHLAARFAAKEAILKALGTGLDNGIAWTDVEVTRDPTGRPGVVLYNKALETADQLGIMRWLITLGCSGVPCLSRRMMVSTSGSSGIWHDDPH